MYLANARARNDLLQLTVEQEGFQLAALYSEVRRIREVVAQNRPPPASPQYVHHSPPPSPTPSERNAQPAPSPSQSERNAQEDGSDTDSDATVDIRNNQEE